VYIITGTNNPGDLHSVVDVGEAQNVKNRVSTHDRTSCWNSRGFKTLYASVIYCNEQQRMLIERQLRNILNPPCGER